MFHNDNSSEEDNKWSNICLFDGHSDALMTVRFVMLQVFFKFVLIYFHGNHQLSFYRLYVDAFCLCENILYFHHGDNNLNHTRLMEPEIEINKYFTFKLINF